MSKKGKKSSKKKTKTKAQKMAVANKALGGTASAAAANKAAGRAAAASRYATSQAAKSDKAMSNAGVSGVGPVASGSTYANALSNTTQGIGPVSSGSTYAGAVESQKKPTQTSANKQSGVFSDTRLPLGGGVFNPFNSFTPEARLGMLSGYADSAVDGINFAKNLVTGGHFKDKFNVPKIPKFQDASMQKSRNIASVALPIGQGLSNVSKFKAADEIAKMTMSNKAFKAGLVPQLTKSGITNVNPFTFAKAFSPQMLATGPTAGATMALNAGMTGATIGDKVGGLNVTSPANASVLNFGGISDEAGTTKSEKSNLGRALTFGQNLLQQPKALAAYGVDLASRFFGEPTADGTLTGNMDFAGNLPGDKGFDSKDVQVKQALGALDRSQFAQQVGENLGLPKDFKAQTKDALAALSENYQGATADRDGIYAGTSETLKNLTSDKRLAPLAKYLNQLGTDNENVTDADRDKKFSVMGFQTPFTNEQATDVITAFQPNAATMAGLSQADRGLIQGGLGNRIVSGKLTDIAREAITGNIGTGDSLGLSTGSPLTIGNMIDAGGMIASNLQQDGTLAQKRSNEIANLANKTGQITTPSLIKSLIPGIGSNKNRGTTNKVIGGATGGAANVLPLLQQPIQQPILPEYVEPDRPNLQNIQQQAYNKQMSIYGIPNYTAQFRQTYNRPKRFRQIFNRDYFTKFL